MDAPHRPARPWFGVVALAAALGCTGVGVRRADRPDLLAAVRASTAAEGQLSARSLQTLHRWDLDRLYRRDPAEAFRRLQAAAAQDPQSELLFALAEAGYLLGRDAEKHDNPHACAYYYLCAGYAYHYLFDAEGCGLASAGIPAPGDCGPPRPPAPCPAPTVFDPRFRLACDLYNAGLAQCIRAAQRVGRLDPRQQLRLPTPDGQGFTLSVMHHGFAWKAEEFGPLLFCEDFQVVGLDNHYRGYGLGVPLIGTRAATAPAPGGAFYPRDVSFPATAFFRFEGGVADLGTQRCGRLELYNPLAVRAVEVRHRPVPLEADLTTPLAYFLSRTDLEGVEFTGFLRADKLRDRTGIYMFEPYQPGKIPVVMVHGLLASPLTWATMFNDLRADPVLRERFQFWFYLYPTGNPYLATAADLRQTLADLRRELDPRRQDRALDDMVLVGHSMGGLVSKLLTVDSGDDFWRLVSSEPFDGLRAKPETRAELRRLFFFERQPSVRRVVFLATPHHGSKLSPSPLGRLGAQFVGLSQMLMAAAKDVAREDPQALAGLRNGRLPTSVDMLAPGSPALELLAARPRPPAVHYHSILGNVPLLDAVVPAVLVENFARESGDGVVPYRSAHLDDAESEVVVPADHNGVHSHPLAVREVRRILLEHLRGD